jgi:hypothetical protein
LEGSTPEEVLRAAHRLESLAQGRVLVEDFVILDVKQLLGSGPLL